MKELYDWLTVWERNVNSNKRPSETPSNKPRRKVKVKK